MSNHRFYAIDHLRTSMMFVVMLGHPLLPYVTVPRVFSDPSNHISFDYFAVFLYSFAMQTFFVTAGFAAALILERKGMKGLWKNRLVRIFIPLLVAYICISPLMRGAYQFSAGVVEYQSIAAGWQIFLEAQWLRWGKVYHLWFLVSLLVFTGLSCICLWCLNKTQHRHNISTNLNAVIQKKFGIIFLIAFVIVTTIPSYIFDTGRGTHWSMQITLWIYFAIGWFIYHHTTIIDIFKRVWHYNLIIALSVLPICIWSTRERLFNENNVDVLTGTIAGLANGILGICMTIALIGWFYIKLDKPSKLGDMFSKSSYWVYLIHFPIVVAIGGIISVLNTSPFIKYVLTIALSIPVIAISYYALVLKTPLKFVIIGKSRSVSE